MARLNLMIWSRFINDCKRAPKNIEEFLRKSYGVANLIKIKDRSLNAYWYSWKKFKLPFI